MLKSVRWRENFAVAHPLVRRQKRRRGMLRHRRGVRNTQLFFIPPASAYCFRQLWTKQKNVPQSNGSVSVTHGATATVARRMCRLICDATLPAANETLKVYRYVSDHKLHRSVDKVGLRPARQLARVHSQKSRQKLAAG